MGGPPEPGPGIRRSAAGRAPDRPERLADRSITCNSTCASNRRRSSIDPIQQRGGVIMNVALIIFDNMTALDFVGFYDAVTRLQTMKIQPEFEWTICARQPQVRDDRGLTMAVESVDESLAGY